MKVVILKLSLKTYIHRVKDKNYLSVTVNLDNKGTKRMYIDKAHIFLDEGIVIGDEIEFSKLRYYEEEHELCKLSEICDQDNLTGYPLNLLNEKFKGIYTKHIELEYLSKEFKWIESNEDIEETKVIILPKKDSIDLLV